MHETKGLTCQDLQMLSTDLPGCWILHMNNPHESTWANKGAVCKQGTLNAFSVTDRDIVCIEGGGQAVLGQARGDGFGLGLAVLGDQV